MADLYETKSLLEGAALASVDESHHKQRIRSR